MFQPLLILPMAKMSVLKARVFNVLIITVLNVGAFNASPVWASPPSTPDAFRFEAYSSTTIELFWNRSTDDVVVVGYEITRNGTLITTLDGLSFVDQELVQGPVYTYTVTAVDNDGNRSDPVSLEASVGPAAPTGLTVSVYSATAAELTWDRPADAFGLTYEIKRDGTVLSTTDGVSYFSDSFVAGEVYQFTIIANDSLGKQSPPSSISVTTYAGEAPTLFSAIQKTGQTLSEYPGDDGDWQTGVASPEPRFVVNVNPEDDLDNNGFCNSAEICNGTLTDKLTGLIWLAVTDCMYKVTWVEALSVSNQLAGNGDVCAGLIDGSVVGDWRLPNVRELQSRIDYSRAGPSMPEEVPYAPIPGSDLGWFSYWSSTTNADANSHSADAGSYVVDYFSAETFFRPRTQAYVAISVRGGY